MPDYITNYAIRYSTPALNPVKTEVAVITAAQAIQNEDPTTPDHANRLRWANWVIPNSNTAWLPFSWPVAMNPTIQAAVEADPSGNTVQDSDVQFVVNSNVEAVITNWIANQPAS